MNEQSFRTSATLLNALRAKPDDRLWQRFVEIYGPMICRWLVEYGLQDSDVQDVGQEVLLGVFRSMPQFQYDREIGAFRGWLRGHVRNRLLEFWRTRDRLKKHGAQPIDELESRLADLENPHSVVAERLDGEELRARVMMLISAEFEEATWRAFWLQVVDGEKPAKVAADLGLSVSAVYTAKSRVLQRLREKKAELNLSADG